MGLPGASFLLVSQLDQEHHGPAIRTDAGQGADPMDHETSDLRRQARLNEVDRQLASHRFRLAAMKWVVVPVMLLTGGYVAYVLHGRGMPSTENLMAGLGGVASVLLAGVGGYRAQWRRLGELEQERAELESVTEMSRMNAPDSNR